MPSYKCDIILHREVHAESEEAAEAMLREDVESALGKQDADFLIGFRVLGEGGFTDIGKRLFNDATKHGHHDSIDGYNEKEIHAAVDRYLQESCWWTVWEVALGLKHIIGKLHHTKYCAASTAILMRMIDRMEIDKKDFGEVYPLLQQRANEHES